MSHIRNSPVGRAVAESMPFILPVAILAGTKGLYELVPIGAFVGIVAVLSTIVYLRHLRDSRAESPQAKEDELSMKAKKAQSIAQELEREAANEDAARERKKSAADKKKKKGGAQQPQQSAKKGQGSASPGMGAGMGAAEEEDEDDMLVRMAQQRAKKGGR